MQNFLDVLLHYIVEILPSLALGFLLSGIVHEFISNKIVEKHLGGKGFAPLLYATLVGAILPICCVGSLPVALSLREKGASIGAVMAFLIATPATSLSALIVCYSLLGLKFTVYIFFAVIFMGIAMGALANLFDFKIKADAKAVCACHSKDKHCERIDPVCGMAVSEHSELTMEFDGTKFFFCSAHCKAKFQSSPDKYFDSHEHEECEHCSAENRGVREKLIDALKFAFVEMPRDIGLELVLGLLLAALIASFDPIGRFVQIYLAGALAYPVSLFFGIMMYICSTASVPLVQALISQGMNIGAAMVLLLVGPITSWGTILVVRSQFGGKTLAFYLGGISLLSLLIGFVYTLI